MKDQRKAGVILSYLSTGISILIQLVYMPVMIRLLGQSEYGLYSLVSGVVSYLSLFSLGFTGAYLRFFSRENQKKDRDSLAALNGMFIALFLVLASAALVCGFALSCFPKQVFGSKLSSAELLEARILMVILVVNIAISLVSGIFDSIINAYEQFVFQRILSLLATVINPLICLPLLLMGYGNVMLVVVATCMTVSRLIVNIWFCLHKLKIPISFHGFQLSLLKEVGVFSFFLLLNMVIDQINWTNEVAVYGVASQINNLVMIFSTTISSVFSPRINRIAADDSVDSQREFTLLMAKVGRVQWMVLGLVTMGFVVFGKYFIVNIYAGREYENAYLASLFLVIPALVPLIQNTGIEVQRALNRHQFRSMIYFIMAILNVFMSIPLAARFGSVGAAMGTAISLVLANGIIMNVFYHKALKIDMVFFWKEIGKTLPGFLIPSILGALIVRHVSFDSLMKYAVWIVVFAVVYCLSIYCLSCNKRERALVLGMIRRNQNES